MNIGSGFAPGRGLRGKRRLHRWTMESEWVEPQTGCPSPRDLCMGDKPPWLLGESLGQIKMFRLHSRGVCRYWLVTRQGGERCVLVASTSLHSSIQTSANTHSMPQLSTESLVARTWENTQSRNRIGLGDQGVVQERQQWPWLVLTQTELQQEPRLLTAMQPCEFPQSHACPQSQPSECSSQGPSMPQPNTRSRTTTRWEMMWWSSEFEQNYRYLHRQTIRLLLLLLLLSCISRVRLCATP